MTTHENPDAKPSTLPELERLLLRAARRRTPRRVSGRRWVLGLTAGSLVLAGGAAAAVTDVFHIADGTTSGGGAYTIDRRAASPGDASTGRPDSICLQLRANGGGPAYGCGERPTPTKPFGIVVADPLGASSERVVYGLVSTDIARVSVLGEGDRHTDTTTREKPSLPGRFFSVVVPNRGRIELVGYDTTGQERARIGSRARPDHAPRSHDEAVAQGDPAGFAPAVAMPTTFSYHGTSITPAEAAERDLSCTQDREGVRCDDSLAELDADKTRSPNRP